MKTWSEWEIIRRQVAICGRVVDEDGNSMSNLPVTIISMPEVFATKVSVAASAIKRRQEENDESPDRTVTKNNGSYYFLDLPNGKYGVNVNDVRTGLHDQKEASVKRDKNGKIKMAILNMQIATHS